MKTSTPSRVELTSKAARTRRVGVSSGASAGVPSGISAASAADGGAKGRLFIPLYVLAILAVWQLGAEYAKIPSYVLPRPLDIYGALIQHHQTILSNMMVTVYEIAAGFGLGILLGFLFALIVINLTFLRETIVPALVALQAVPKIALAPLFLLWFGIDTAPKIAMAAVFSFFPVFFNTVSGMDQVDVSMIELSRVLNASRWQTFMKFRFPHSLPYAFAGVQIAAPLAIVGAIIGEFTSAERGLGNLILIAGSYLNTSLVFAVVFVLTLLSVILFAIIRLAEMLVIPWAQKNRR